MKSIVIFLILNAFLLVSSYNLNLNVENWRIKAKSSLELENFLNALRNDKVDYKSLENEHNEALDDLDFDDLQETQEATPFDTQQLPAKLDWRVRKAVTPVQSQGKCGCGYAFAAIAAIESSICIKTGRCVKLSEQEAMECTNGCAGGNSSTVFKYAKQYGCTSTKNVPYIADDSVCIMNKNRAPNSKVIDVKRPILNNKTSIMEHLVKFGPLYASLYPSQSFANFRGKSVFDDCNAKPIGSHAVLIIGYAERRGVEYWIIKNSESTKWGNEGFGYIRKGVNCLKIESIDIAFPVIKT